MLVQIVTVVARCRHVTKELRFLGKGGFGFVTKAQCSVILASREGCQRSLSLGISIIESEWCLCCRQRSPCTRTNLKSVYACIHMCSRFN